MTDGEIASDPHGEDKEIQGTIHHHNLDIEPDPPSSDAFPILDELHNTDEHNLEEREVENGVEVKGEDEGPPTKKRRVSENAALARRKPESPPWKRVVAEGPSSFTQDGMRKSGRTNAIPLELQPPSEKRQTRGAQRTHSTKSKSSNSNVLTSPSQSRDVPTSNGTKKPGLPPTSKSPTKPLLSPTPKRSHKKKIPTTEPVPVPKRSHKKKVPVSQDPQPAPAEARPSNGRRPRTSDVGHEDSFRSPALKMEGTGEASPKAKLARIRFRVRPATLPYPHAGLVRTRARQFPTLKEYFDHSANIPVEDGGLYHPDDGLGYTEEMIKDDARLLLRIEEAAEPGGVLGPGLCSVYQPEEPIPFPRQFAHQDHMNAAAAHFRKLMIMEQRKHRANAKRLAEACRDEWNRRQPKSLEQLEMEEIKAGQARYKSLVKTIQATWENVRVEVNRRRVLEWEAQEQIRVRKALNEAVDISTQKLQARRAHMDSEDPSDDDGEEEEEEDSDDNNEIGEDGEDAVSVSDKSERNMSDSESEEDTGKVDIADDENLTVEQLREKYASIQARSDQDEDEEMIDPEEDRTPEPEPASVVDMEDGLDDSDESVDMDDDMGSSDEDRDSDEDDSGEEEDDSEEDAGESSLLGFLAPSDLKSIKEIPGGLADAVPDEESSLKESGLDTEMSGIDEPAIEEAIGEAADEPAMEELPENEDIMKVDETPIRKQIVEAATTSPDHSSEPTPRTSDTRASDVDSVSSVDHQTSRQVTQSSTPQPGSNLKTPVPFLLRGTLREYQHYGLDWLANLYANNTNGILADEMGLGKTIQTIALLAHLACHHEVWGPHLVIVPTSVMLNWEMEFKKWCPGFKILTYYGNQEERKRKRQGWRTDDHWNVCITSYQLILADQQVFKRRQWHYMILDEAHNIKNFQSQRWQTMLTFQTRARLLLTGTPLQNNLTELWSLLYFLMPSDGTDQGVGGFANLKEFQDWFKKPSEQILEHGRETMDDESRAIIAKLHKVLRPYLLRRLKADVEKQMPAKYEHVEWCRLSKRQRELYDGFLSRDDTRGTLASGNYLSIINCLMQLRKVCNHPDLFIERAIMTSFPMEKSAIADFEVKELLVRKLLREDPMTKASLEFLNLVPAKHEVLSAAVTTRSAALSASRTLMDLREAQRTRAQAAFTTLNTTTANSNLVYLESASRWGRFEELQHCVYLNALRRQQKPIYGTKLVEFLTLGIENHPLKPRPRRRDQWMTWLEDTSPTLTSMVPTLSLRSQSMRPLIQKFACVTPPVIARDMTPLALTSKGVEVVQNSVDPGKIDPFHEARMRLSIQFPDKRLLQYDCGKLQTLDKLLRRLQAGGHRALIFTQMTKVLDILEQFLNIHGHKYLRLDGSTKIEQRQILTDRFNNDKRILAFILSTRSGGLGINLTGADTVIFYDLDWNPAMDKQCQDRCHRIGQTRDVHIYRLVSEHTIEANILRKANQKQMLDDVVIQEGDFTTDYFNKMNVKETQVEDSDLLDGDGFANAAMDRVLGGAGNNKDMQRVIAQAEDTEDVVAAKIAEREVVQTDAADFDENVVTNDATPAGVGTPIPTPAGVETPLIEEILDPAEEVDEQNAWGEQVHSTDDYMLSFMAEQLKDTPVELPKDRSKSKKGKDHRSHRTR